MISARRRSEELLADVVTEGLPPLRELELSGLEPSSDDLRFDFERAAAAIDLAFGYRQLEIPSRLVERVRDQARGFMAASCIEKPPTAEPPGPQAATGAVGSGERRLWLLAAAALVLAILGWWPRLPSMPPKNGWGVADRDIESDPALITLSLAATEDPAAQGASATLEWSPSLQRGRLWLVGLAANDPTEIQYQLWIFDASRDDRYPVDGGVFDVKASGATWVAVKPSVPVRSPRLFAVTIESAGGVVVSAREHVVLVGEHG